MATAGVVIAILLGAVLAPRVARLMSYGPKDPEDTRPDRKLVGLVDQIDAPAEAKTEARGVIQHMRQAGAATVSAVAREVLAAAVRQALGLP